MFWGRRELKTIPEWKDMVSSSFAQKRALTRKEKFFLKIFYKCYVFFIKIVSLKAFLYLLVTHPSIIFIQLKARKLGGRSGGYQWTRLAEISYFVNSFRPVSVCEFGSGTSSALFAMLCPNRFTTFEEDKYWEKNLRRNLGDLCKKMDLIRADRIIEIKKDKACCYYDFDHSKYYDFIYVDGPETVFPEELEHLKVKDVADSMVDIDVELLWEREIYPRLILVDCRRASVSRLIEKMNDKYDVYLRSDFLIRHNKILMAHFLYHTVMVRKE